MLGQAFEYHCIFGVVQNHRPGTDHSAADHRSGTTDHLPKNNRPPTKGTTTTDLKNHRPPTNSCEKSDHRPDYGC